MGKWHWAAFSSQNFLQGGWQVVAGQWGWEDCFWLFRDAQADCQLASSRNAGLPSSSERVRSITSRRRDAVVGDAGTTQGQLRDTAPESRLRVGQ